ncbi:MAG: penicillin-binding protein activator [Gammaproteobacteria bacterium]|nr:penicillin-binding protein activator [Gammaproteobacteria bacterium]MDH4253780.1 penicillin-binding protein activator [Gammaproteobacteria bacterium]MDH5308647.1 penicillin-binding protein activator [Gammaproteobacteria bacterium]
MKLLRNLGLILIAAALATACASADFAGRTGSQAERRAESLARQGRHEDAAAAYIGLASARAGEERDRLTLLAVEQWLDAGDGRRARGALSEVAPPAAGDLRWLWTTDRAAIELWEGKPDSALALLEPMSAEALPTRHRARLEALRADAWFQKGDPLRAVDLYLRREQWLDDPDGVTVNRQRLWAGLSVSSPQVLRQASEIAVDELTRGWLTLGALATSTGQQGIGWSNGVLRWRQANPDHPAIEIVAGLELPDRGLREYPRQIALLLPLSGRNATAGRAVQNGFFGAYYSAAVGFDDVQQVRVYDVEEGGVRGAYSKAVVDGADFVVGPLLRDSVIALAGESLLPVPVLALNYLPDNAFVPPGMYQFSLAPEDEAVSAATRAAADGHALGVALVPNTDWGRRMLTSFATEFESHGGTLLEYRSYEPDAQDFSFEIENLMGLADSVQRYRRLRANIGSPLQFDPRRRQDVDFIFLAAAAPAGRLLKSQLKFHYSGDVPVYSTSRIYGMDGRSDSDLDGVMFADVPWIVAPAPWQAELATHYAEYWPAQRRLGRLHAMGYDAYQLANELFVSRSGSIGEIGGATGQLYLDETGRVHRRLAWGVFKGGNPAPLPAPGRSDELAVLDEPEATGTSDTDAAWPGSTLDL